MTQEHCPFCNLTVAPADPYRVCYRGQVAHQYCILSSRQQVDEFCHEVCLFLSSCHLPEVRSYWSELRQTKRLNSYQTIVHELRVCLCRIERWRQTIGESGENAWPTTAYVNDWQKRFNARLLIQL